MHENLQPNMLLFKIKLYKMATRGHYCCFFSCSELIIVLISIPIIAFIYHTLVTTSFIKLDGQGMILESTNYAIQM